MTQPLDLIELQNLLAAATPGPWRFDPFRVATVDDGAVAAGAGPAIVPGFRDGKQADANAALIVAAVNALPSLIDRLQGADAEINAFVEHHEAAMADAMAEERAAEARATLAFEDGYQAGLLAGRQEAAELRKAAIAVVDYEIQHHSTGGVGSRVATLRTVLAATPPLPQQATETDQ